MVKPAREIIGVIHLPRLPSIVYNPGVGVDEIIGKAVEEAKILDELGYTGVIVENYGDYPYPKRTIDPLTLSVIAIIAREIVRNTGLKVGLNILRNSGREAYAIAIASGARFIRVNSLIETIASDSGIIEPEAPRLKPLILNYPGVEIYADILVKHASSLRTGLSIIESTSIVLSKGSLEEYLQELIGDYIDRGKASKLVVTGLRTGLTPPLNHVRLIKRYSPIPVIVGSGVTLDNAIEVLRECDGAIIGSYIKTNGKAGNPLDKDRARRLIEKIQSEYRITR